MEMNLINTDCLQALQECKDKQFNLALTDPPYNVGRKYNEYDDTRQAEEYEHTLFGLFIFSVSVSVLLTYKKQQNENNKI